MVTQTLGEFRIDRVVESEGAFAPASMLMPGFDPAVLAAAQADDWLRPQFLTADDSLVMSFQSFVIRTGRLTVLVDGCVGNDKERPNRESWHRRQSSAYLDQLAALGLSPADIDVVLCTHLHADHVGWNTVLRDGRWVPTFPRARYLFSRAEYEFWERAHREALATGGPATNHGSFADSVLPVMEAGRAELVGAGHDVCAGLRIDAAPGHTPGNSVIAVQSGGSGPCSPGMSSTRRFRSRCRSGRRASVRTRPNRPSVVKGCSSTRATAARCCSPHIFRHQRRVWSRALPAAECVFAALAARRPNQSRRGRFSSPKNCAISAATASGCSMKSM